jgi:hypothetical protein
VERPDRPTWSGDRIHATGVRLERDHALDLALLWPYLWLTMTDSQRAAVSTARDALNRGATLAAWAILYALLVFWWWPALPIGIALGFIARKRIRHGSDAFARLVEAIARMNTAELADKLRIPMNGPLPTGIGEDLRERLDPPPPAHSG